MNCKVELQRTIALHLQFVVNGIDGSHFFHPHPPFFNFHVCRCDVRLAKENTRIDKTETYIRRWMIWGYYHLIIMISISPPLSAYQRDLNTMSRDEVQIRMCDKLRCISLIRLLIGNISALMVDMAAAFNAVVSS